jgi:hypothetical protein
VRVSSVVLAALVLRAAPAYAPRRERRLVLAVNDADAATLDRQALGPQRTALIASLWPEARPCLVPTLYLVLPAPALLGAGFQVSRQAQHSLEASHVFPLAEGEIQVVRPRAA